MISHLITAIINVTDTPKTSDARKCDRLLSTENTIQLPENRVIAGSNSHNRAVIRITRELRDARHDEARDVGRDPTVPTGRRKHRPCRSSNRGKEEEKL